MRRGPFAFVAGLVLLVPGASRAGLTADYVRAALRGDLREMRPVLEAADSSLAAADRELAAKFRARFTERTERPEPLPVAPAVQEIVDAYRDYWTRSLLGEFEGDQGEKLLFASLRATLRGEGRAIDDAEEPLEAMGELLAAQGLHHIGGRTRPYLELMLWAREDTTRWEAELTDGRESVEIVFVRDFLVKGWADWATFGRASTGGWATRERLFCLGDDYDLESEKFLVSYVKHEGRHFADYKIFPALAQPDLEYRAKLTELVYAEQSLAPVLESFAVGAAMDANAPHAWANACVIRDLAAELGLGDPPPAGDPRWLAPGAPSIHAAARALLERHTEHLVAAGAERVTAWVGPAAP